MRMVLGIVATLVLVALFALVVWAHELARPHMQIRRQLADEDEEGAY
jgi:hypothetical protein